MVIKLLPNVIEIAVLEWIEKKYPELIRDECGMKNASVVLKTTCQWKGKVLHVDVDVDDSKKNPFDVPLEKIDTEKIDTDIVSRLEK